MVNLLEEPNVVVFLVTSLFAFLAWMIKGLIEKPIADAKATFSRISEKRIEILAEVKTLLAFISYMPEVDESKEYKEKLQELLLKEGKSAYLSKDSFDSVLRIAVDLHTDKQFVFNTIKVIEEDIYSNTAKLKEELDFYKSYSNFNPFRRFIGFTVLLIQYFLSISLVALVMFLIVYGFFSFGICMKILITLLVIIILYLSTTLLGDKR